MEKASPWSMVGCVVIAAVLAMSTSACSSDGGGGTTGSPSASDGAAYPVSLQNCGRTITVRSDPDRVVSLWQSTTEALLALGLRERIVAVQKSYAPYAPSVADAARGLKDIGSSMSFPSTTLLFGAPRDVTLSELAIEIFLPADAATVERLPSAGN